MTPKENTCGSEETGVDDVRRVREQIAAEHQGDLNAHVAETNRIAEEARQRLRLGPIVPARGTGESGVRPHSRSQKRGG